MTSHDLDEGNMICLSTSYSRDHGGCLIGVAAFAAPAPTFNRDVMPILQGNCQRCHGPGEIAPMSLLTYTDARPWAKAIKAAVVTRRCRRDLRTRRSVISLMTAD